MLKIESEFFVNYNWIQLSIEFISILMVFFLDYTIDRLYEKYVR